MLYHLNIILHNTDNNDKLKSVQNEHENILKIREYYKNEFINAFSEWSKATNFSLSFAEGDESSNIIIKFSNHNPADSDDKKYVVAYTTPDINKNYLKRMNIIFYSKDPQGNYYSQNQVYNTALHEIAHALGVMGHSNNKKNIIFV